MAEWTEIGCGDGAAILRDGEMIPIEDIIATLNGIESAAAAAVAEMDRKLTEAKRIIHADLAHQPKFIPERIRKQKEGKFVFGSDARM